ncbi:hypothetical protein [Kitasatospora sp. McL0602]|uniref:hypothetical protein n=1 Tax=Kitasatospora sp. McL0602 TaxID=3439530 RepID=UPI003F8B5360
MIDEGGRPGGAWWGTVRTAFGVGWRLLVVQVVFSAVGVGGQWVGWALQRAGMGLAGYVVMLLSGGLAAAWGWSAKLRILDGGHGVAAALRPDLRRVGRLAVWLVVLGLVGLLEVLRYLDVRLYVDLVVSSAILPIQLGALYLAFGAALLPMAVLLEGRGFGRAWGLSHGDWRTALRVLPVVLVHSFLSAMLEQVQLVELASHTPPSELLPAYVLSCVLAALLALVTTVLLYAAYRSAPRRVRRAAPVPRLQEI